MKYTFFLFKPPPGPTKRMALVTPARPKPGLKPAKLNQLFFIPVLALPRILAPAPKRTIYILPKYKNF